MMRSTGEYSSDLHELSRMRALARRVCRQQWGELNDEEAIRQLELAVGEAAANIILHAYQRQPGRPVILEIAVDDELACVTFYHCGADFDPESVAPPSFDPGQESGYGLYLIQQSVDDVRFFRDEHGRCGIRLLKKRRPFPQEEATTCKHS
jgi:anti-sigma regulatory factor (Ser/Thr protein kinase)